MWTTIIVEQYTLLPPDFILIESILSQRLPTGRRYLADLQVDSERIIVTFQPVRARLGKWPRAHQSSGMQVTHCQCCIVRGWMCSTCSGPDLGT